MSRKILDGFVQVPTGPFIYGPEVTYERLELAPPPRSRQERWLEEFWIGRYPVTYAGWQRFLETTGYHWMGAWWRIQPGWRGLRQRYVPGETYPPEMASYPMVDVTQSDALAYCRWLSESLDLGSTGIVATLPDEFQWEKAARGDDGRTYPWGEEPPRPELMRLPKTHRPGLSYLFYNLFVRPEREWARSGWYWRLGAPLPVGAIPQNVSPYGCYDMAGNIWEWTSSLYNDAVPHFHVVKGGSWGYSHWHAACNCRSACSITIPSQDYHAQGTGFRVALVPAGSQGS